MANLIPEGFPHKALIDAVGITTLEQLQELQGDYSSIAGVGGAKGTEINIALEEALNQVQNEGTQAEPQPESPSIPEPTATSDSPEPATEETTEEQDVSEQPEPAAAAPDNNAELGDAPEPPAPPADEPTDPTPQPTSRKDTATNAIRLGRRGPGSR